MEYTTRLTVSLGSGGGLIQWNMDEFSLALSMTKSMMSAGGNRLACMQ